MSRSELLPFLNLGTLVVVQLIVAIAFALFMRRRSNRHPMENVTDRNVSADIDAGRSAPATQAGAKEGDR